VTNVHGDIEVLDSASTLVSAILRLEPSVPLGSRPPHPTRPHEGVEADHQRPPRPVLEAVGDTIRHVITTGNRTVVKQLLSELTNRIDVHHNAASSQHFASHPTQHQRPTNNMAGRSGHRFV
jgi:hypothetical protein